MSRGVFSWKPRWARAGFMLRFRRRGMARSSRRRRDSGMDSRAMNCFIYSHKAIGLPFPPPCSRVSLKSPSSELASESAIESTRRCWVVFGVWDGSKVASTPFLEMIIALAVVERPPRGYTPNSESVPSPLSFKRQAKCARY
jgi:hypothetical protein